MLPLQSVSISAHVQPANPVSLEILLRNLPGAVYRCRQDNDWTMEFISDGIEEVLGYSASAFMTPPCLSFASLIHPDDCAFVAETVTKKTLLQKPFEMTYRMYSADGQLKWIREQGVATYDAADGQPRLEGFLSDVTSAYLAEMRLQEQALFLQRARDAIVVLDLDSRITYWNDGAERLYGWEAGEILGKNFCELICEVPHEYFDAFRTTLNTREWVGELAHLRRDGTKIEADTRWTLFPPDERLKTVAKILLISTDISERKRNEEQIQRLAYFDALTGLPNRANLLEHLHQVVIGSARTRQYGAVLFCDLDKFKVINDTEGHAAGDMVLQAIANRLKHCVREADLVARLSGDEFVVLLRAAEPSREAAALHAEIVASKIVSALAAPVRIADRGYPVSVSVGVKVFCGTQDSVESTLGDADAAMYQAKAYGRSTFRFHDPAVQAASIAKAELEQALRRALRDNEFMLHYQPQLDWQNRVVGAEALLRWRLPNGKILFPVEFIGVAEDSRLIIDIGKWVLRSACVQLASWQRSFAWQHLALSINISARQFVEPGFVEALEEIIEETGVNPSCLKLELTESLMIRDFELTIETMSSLKKRGLCFSLDDFGTGYSSLAYLSRLPLDQLKIDYCFIRNVLTDQNNAAIVRSIIGLGANLGLQVIAEGVETVGQQQFLWNAGCRLYQGYLYNKPLHPDQFAQYAWGRA